MAPLFVPESFDPPVAFAGAGFRLEPLDVHHNERDYEAWTSSIDHIKATPGFADSGWPQPMSLTANKADLERHASDFASRTGFTYTILDGEDVIGCVYIYPSDDEAHDASVRSWVCASRLDMDVVVWRELAAWLAESWPFQRPFYASRV